MLKEKLSYSFAKDLLTLLPEEIHYNLQHGKKPSAVMDDGSRIEYVVANGLDESLIVLDYASRNTAFKKERDELIKRYLDDGDDTYEKHPYLICLKKQYNQCKAIYDNMSYQILKVFDKSEKQVHFELDCFDVPVHGYMDFVTDDCVYELKFTDPKPAVFAKQILNMGWDIQAFLYWKKAQEWGKDFKWIVIGQELPCPQRIYKLPDLRFIENGEAKFSEAEQLFIKFNRNLPINKELYLDAPQWMS